MNYDKILAAHYMAKQPLLIWGSSGYGKTSIVRDFAAKHNFDLKILHAQYIDPMGLFIPSTAEMAELGYVKFYPSDYLYEIFNCNKPTILFLDELTRAKEETFNILTELLLDRCVFGHKVPNKVLMVAASNFSEEDDGVKELPDAVMQRLTHIIHSPTRMESESNLKSDLAKKLVNDNPRLIHTPGEFDIYQRLKSCPRQIDAVVKLAEIKSGDRYTLNNEDLKSVCRGRLGTEAGLDIAFSIMRHRDGRSSKLEASLTPSGFKILNSFEKEGGVIEVVNILWNSSTEKGNHELVATYLATLALPETCRAMQQRGFSYNFTKHPNGENGTGSIEKGGRPWQYYAMKDGRLASTK